MNDAETLADEFKSLFEMSGWRQTLASRYRFRPLVTDRLDGRQIAAHLEGLFRQHGAPLFLKRDNGSPFNCQPVDEVMARFGVLPLNNPPHFPRYNGGMEKWPCLDLVDRGCVNV